MRIRINGFIDFFENGIGFDELDIELFDNQVANMIYDDSCCHIYNGCLDEILDCTINEEPYEELIVMDEYLDNMIKDYTEIIEYGVDIEEVLLAMIHELLEWLLGFEIE